MIVRVLKKEHSKIEEDYELWIQWYFLNQNLLRGLIFYDSAWYYKDENKACE